MIIKLSLIPLIDCITIILEAIRAVRKIPEALDQELYATKAGQVFEISAAAESHSRQSSQFSLERVQGLLRVQPRVSSKVASCTGHAF